MFANTTLFGNFINFPPVQEPAGRENAPAGVSRSGQLSSFSSQEILNCAKIKGCLFLLASLNPA